MKKISTLYKKDPADLSRVINEVNPENSWVFTDHGVKAIRKWDGTACAVIGGELYKRYDVKKGKSVPDGAIPCQEPDSVTGHWPHWVKCDRNNPADQYHFEGFEDFGGIPADGTYELCGPKVQGNPEGFYAHTLVSHNLPNLCLYKQDLNFECLRDLIDRLPYEGMVFHHPDGRMCKLRKSDFGFKR